MYFTHKYSYYCKCYLNSVLRNLKNCIVWVVGWTEVKNRKYWYHNSEKVTTSSYHSTQKTFWLSSIHVLVCVLHVEYEMVFGIEKRLRVPRSISSICAILHSHNFLIFGSEPRWFQRHNRVAWRAWLELVTPSSSTNESVSLWYRPPSSILHLNNSVRLATSYKIYT